MIDSLTPLLDEYIQLRIPTDQFLSLFRVTYDNFFVHEANRVKSEVDQRWNESLRRNQPQMVLFVICNRCGARDSGSCRCDPCGSKALLRKKEQSFDQKTQEIENNFKIKKEKIERDLLVKFYPRVRDQLKERVFEEKNMELMSFYMDCCSRVERVEKEEKEKAQREFRLKVEIREREKATLLEELSRIQKNAQEIQNRLSQLEKDGNTFQFPL